MIKVRVQGDLIVEGTVFAVDPVTHSLILSKFDVNVPTFFFF